MTLIFDIYDDLPEETAVKCRKCKAVLGVLRGKILTVKHRGRVVKLLVDRDFGCIIQCEHCSTRNNIKLSVKEICDK